ncbi:MAG: carbamoyl phosphate synthase large subunit, partial [Rhodobacteraceae bacterium]|nr:carbamoyl phosphate synthase large subunit [Paracoccaceae bacterium]
LKAQMGAGAALPETGTVFVSIKDSDKAPAIVEASRILQELGFTLIATGGTRDFLTRAGIPATRINKVYEGRPHIVDMMKDGGVQIVFNTTEGAQSIADSREIRALALSDRIPYYTTAAGARAAALAIKDRMAGELVVRALQ